jgi:hypothetical protein
VNAAGLRGYTQLLAQLVNDVAGYRAMMRTTIMFVVLEAVLLFVHRSGWLHQQKILLVLVLAALLQRCCGAFLSNAVQQNRPEYACLVPQLRRRLITLMATLYGVNALLVALTCGLVFGHAGYALLAAGLISGMIILMQRFSVIAWAAALLMPFAVQFIMNTLPAVIGNLNEAAVTAAGMLVVIPLMGCALLSLFPKGGDRHWAWYYRFASRQAALTGRSPTPAARGGNLWQQLLRRAYVAALRRDSQPGTTPARSMLHALGPAAHGGSYIICLLLATALALLFVLYFSGNGEPALVLPWFGLVLLCAAGLYAAAIDHSASRYREEQRLYFLTPAAPLAARINRLLGQVLLQRFMGIWLLSLACVALLDSFMLGHLCLRGINFAVAMAYLWTAGSVLKNYAVVQAGTGRRNGASLGVLLVFGTLVALVLRRVEEFSMWYEVGGMLGVLAIARLVLCWRKLMALPPVLPAGRFAM